MKAYIERIKVINPFLNALINDRFESALKEAQQLDIRIEQELSGKKPIDGVSIESMPLLGIPFTCKECIAVKDMYFTAGLYSRKGTKADEDSEVVKNLREAGAIPIG
jgi:fatty acid amide hydrolase 2